MKCSGREVEMEAWYKRIFLWGQTNLTEDDPVNCDLSFWKAYWKETGVEGLIINCGGIVSYYASQYETQYKAKFLNGQDYFGIWNEAAREAGLAVVARMDINATSEALFKEHPEWYCRDNNHEVIRSQGRYVTCVNGGYYREFLPRVFREIIEKYHPDGFADNSWAGLKWDTICYCDACRREFMEECGEELPQKADWSDPVYRKWIRWNFKVRVRNWKEFNRITMEAGGKDCRWFGMLTGDPFNTGGRFYDLKELAGNADFVFSDQQSREGICGFEKNSVSGQILKQLAGENVTVAESMAHYYKGIRTFRLSAAPAAEVRKWMLCGLSGGLAPWYHFVGGGTQDRRKFRISADLFRWLQGTKPYFEKRQNCAAVGLIWNQESAVYYGRGAGEERCGYPFYGFAKALSRAGIPFVPVHADQLYLHADRLRAIILPNVAILSKEQEEQVLHFLDKGGGLVMTGLTGRMDEEGEKKQEDGRLWERLGLRDLEGTVGSEGSADWMNHDSHSYLRVKKEAAAAAEALCAGLEETDLLPFGGEVIRTGSDGRLSSVMHLIPAFPIYPPEFAWIREEAEDVTTVYAGELESGARVVYMPADLDRCYLKYCLPDLGRVLANAVDYAARDRFPVKVEAKGHVHCDAYLQGETLIIHLVNLCGCDGPVGSVTDTLPTGPVSIRIEDAFDRKAVSLVTGEVLPLRREGDCLCIRLERLEEQEMLLLQKK